MKNEHYPFSADADCCYFEFESIGPKGIIIKVVSITFYLENTWNLAFGDKDDEGGFSDGVKSNNGDLAKVMATVIYAAMKFSERWPDRKILIDPVDSKRRSLYNAIFQRHFEEFGEIFLIRGFSNKRLADYDPGKTFDLFVLSRKNTNFVKK